MTDTDPEHLAERVREGDLRLHELEEHADADTAAESREEALDRLRLRAETTDEGWVRGYGYDESEWGETEYLTRGDLDAVAEDRPVVAFREDLHSDSS